jgi:hypothetical protein
MFKKLYYKWIGSREVCCDQNQHGALYRAMVSNSKEIEILVESLLRLKEEVKELKSCADDMIEMKREIVILQDKEQARSQVARLDKIKPKKKKVNE